MNKILVFGILVLSITSVSAQLSPGDLALPHEHLEGLENCTKCHEIGEKLSKYKCLACHTLLRERLEAGQGLHARAEYNECIDCHSDHQGKKFNLIWWKEGQQNFDHSKTGYSLQGKHQNQDCKKCHNSDNITDKQKYTSQGKNLDTTFLGLTKDCLSCHQDEHRGQLDTQCLKCHDYNAWKPVPHFDHNQTKFSLSGRHRSVDCVNCHKKINDRSNDRDQEYLKFSGLAFSNCNSCHRDPHSGRLGFSCKNCHSESGWRSVNNQDFNHDRTRFPLLGKHKDLSCKQCHRPNQSLTSMASKSCQNCHDDYHQGQFYHRQSKGACDECHTEEGFLPANFSVKQHNTTNYPLQGAHLAVPCNFCHTKNVNNTIQFRFSSTACQICHRDPHNRQAEKFLSEKIAPEGKNSCQYCHTVESWASIEFDHNQTNFRLEGKHQSITCVSCHLRDDSDTSMIIRLKLNKNLCQDCHQDIHMGQFYSQNNKNVVLCDKCHTAQNWIASLFNHNRDSQFKLEGAHKKLDCSQCHKAIEKNGIVFVRFKPLSSSCSACHGERSMVQ